MAIFNCKTCSYSTSLLHTFINHAKTHRNLANYWYACGVSQCPCSFKKLQSFRSHMYRNHSESKPQPQAQPQDVVTSCQVAGCMFHCLDFSSLCAHLRGHIADGRKVNCPYTGCTKYFRVRSSFSSHLSRCHKLTTAASHSTPASQQEEPCMLSDELVREVSVDARVEEDVGPDESQFLRNLALFYLKMQAKLLIPATTIQTIIEEYQEVHNADIKYLMSRLRERMAMLNIPDTDINQLLDDVVKDDLFRQCHEGPLRSDQTRKTFFKKNFNYVEPKQMYLGFDAAGIERHFQYVPIKETLRALLTQETVKEQYRQTKIKKGVMSDSGSDVLADVIDGKVIKDNGLLKEDPSSLSIVLYQDSFEVANPLGSARGKHKICAVYMTLCDILPHNRSCVDPMQLVLLCREEDFRFFGQDKIFTPLVSDLKDIEEFGFETEGFGSLKGGLIAISGDNLGSHCVGGFTENFSKSKNFCRYCIINRETFQENPEKVGPKRTVENYKESVLQLRHGQPIVNGIRFDSVFNSLKNFHVCNPGLPPCLGHDLFEGVVSYDLALYLKHLVKVEKHFTYLQLNRSIKQFHHAGNDGNNRPCEVKEEKEKLGGHAAQNWCFLRLLPLYIGDRIQNPVDSQVWQLCLKLREIVELICAAKISHGQIAYLKVLIEEYIHFRHNLFPNCPLKAKHHYLLHYPDLTLQFGPLIRLWTLRFESKHCYFKSCARRLHNFKNLCSSLAERHQLLQAYLGTGQLFSPDVQVVGPATRFEDKLYCPLIQEAFHATSVLKKDTTEMSSVVYKSITYSKGLVVAVSHDDNGIVFGKIVLILLNENRVYLMLEKCESVFLIDVGLHWLNEQGAYMCVDIDSLADYYPLPIYHIGNVSVVVLHHSIVGPSTEH